MAEIYSIGWIKHVLFIYLSVHGYLVCFHLLATMNNIAINFMYKFLFQHVFFLGIYLGEELMDHMIMLGLIFEELQDCFTEWLRQFIFTPSVYKGQISPHKPEICYLTF